MEIGQEELKSVGFEAAMHCVVVERQLLFEESGNKSNSQLECTVESFDLHMRCKISAEFGNWKKALTAEDRCGIRAKCYLE